MYPISKYKFFTNPKTNEVIAVSTFAGRTVKGHAKCHSNDAFNLEIGQKLASLRCGQKIALKRVARARRCVERAEYEYNHALEMRERMIDYLNDAEDELVEIESELAEFERTI